MAHWVNVPLLVIMAGSGLQIWVAYPYLGPRGALVQSFPLQGWLPPEWARIGQWLAGARHWHFAFMWLFLLNGLLYLGYLAASGEWRQRLFLPRRDTANALATAAYYLRLRRVAPESTPYNGLQRLSYTLALLFGALSVVSGWVLYKPVQLQLPGMLLGGYEGAKLLHTASLALLLAFTLTHVVLVALHPRTVVTMVTGRGHT